MLGRRDFMVKMVENNRRLLIFEAAGRYGGDIDMQEIYELLYRLGATANYVGFFQTASAVRLCAEHHERLLLVTKLVYPDVAKQFRTNWQAVERNIRTVVCTVWRHNRPLLEKLACRPLDRRPRTSQFLSILSYNISTREPEAAAVR